MIDGYFEECGPVWVAGWLKHKESSEPVHFVITSDGTPIYEGVANLFRADLLEAGIGDGNHAFRVAVPGLLFDGKPHSIELRERNSGVSIKGSPLKFSGKSIPQEQLQIDGNLLRSSGISHTLGEFVNSEVTLIEGDEIIARGKIWLDQGKSGKIDLAIPLPPSVFDGRPHAFQVFTEEGTHLGSAAYVMPNSLTSDAVLLQYAREGMSPSLSALAGFRYESLVQSLQHAQKNASYFEMSISDYIAQLNFVHFALVRGFKEADQNYQSLVFPKYLQPKVSIIVPLHNQFHVTYHCLLSILLAFNHASYELILVDDGSEDQTKNISDLVTNVTYLRNNEAEGFIRACNRGASQAQGQFIVFLNNDTEVTSSWLDELCAIFEHYDNVGAAGSKLIFPDGKLQEAGGIVWNSGNPWNYGRQKNPYDPKYSYARQVDYLSGAALMVSKSIWQSVGGFCEDYIPAYFEDTDLCFAIRSLGFKTIFSPLSIVIHIEGGSNGTDTTSGIKKYQEISRPKFKLKWAKSFKENGREGREVDLHKDRNIEGRVFVLDAETPMSDINAGSYAAIQEMRLLQALGFKCTFMPSNSAWMGRYTRDLQRMGIETIYAPFAGSIHEFLQIRGSEFDFIYVTRYYVAQEFYDSFKKFAPQAKIILMNADLHFLREIRSAFYKSSDDDLKKAMLTKDSELETMRKVDLVLTYTDIEKSVIFSHDPKIRVAKCPWVREVSSSPIVNFGQRKDIAFLGGFGHPPNIDAVEWFLTKVWDTLAAKLPNVYFRIYGSKIPKSLLTLSSKYERVEVGGWVQSTADVYQSCRLFVAPLQSGAGIKGKVIDAMAYGVPCIMSQIAAEGILEEASHQKLIPRSPKDWQESILALYESEKEWQAASQISINTIKAKFNFENGIEQMQEALKQCELYVSPTDKTLIWKE